MQKMLKVAAVIVLFPLVAGLVKGLIDQINGLDAASVPVYWGFAAYLLIHLFILEPLEFYKNTQRFLEYILGVFSPLFRVSYYIMPFWALVVLAAYFIAAAFLGSDNIRSIFYFLTTLVFTMHVVMVARLLRTDELREIFDYLFVIFIVFVLNVLFFSLNMRLYNPGFSVTAVTGEGLAFIKWSLAALADAASGGS